MIAKEVFIIQDAQISSWKEQVQKSIEKYSGNKRFIKAENYWRGVLMGIEMMEHNVFNTIKMICEQE